MPSAKGPVAHEGGGRAEVVCVATGTLVFLWLLYWLVLKLHWSLQWLLFGILVLLSLRTCGYAVDIDRKILEPMSREFPELTEVRARH